MSTCTTSIRISHDGSDAAALVAASRIASYAYAYATWRFS
jgi:hypothetical protein